MESKKHNNNKEKKTHKHNNKKLVVVRGVEGEAKQGKVIMRYKFPAVKQVKEMKSTHKEYSQYYHIHVG